MNLQDLTPKAQTSATNESITVPFETYTTQQFNESTARPLANRSNDITTMTIIDEEAANTSVPNTSFKAFPQKRWWKSLMVAKATLGFVSMVVVGNLIYAIITTAKGRNIVEDF